MTKLNPPNYTMIPNDLLGDPVTQQIGLMAKMSDPELRVYLTILRGTIGYHRRDRRLSVRKIAASAGLSNASVQAGAERLMLKGLIKSQSDGGVTAWSLVTEWGDNDDSVPYPTGNCPCGRIDVAVDVHHIKPVSYGGNDAKDNLVTLCVSCHKKVHSELRSLLKATSEPTDTLFKQALNDVILKNSVRVSKINSESVSGADTPTVSAADTPVSRADTPSKKEIKKESLKEMSGAVAPATGGWENWTPQVVEVPQGGNKASRAAFEAKCSECHGKLTQELDICPNPACGQPIQWVGSPLADKRQKHREAAAADQRAKDKLEKQPTDSTAKQILAKAMTLSPCRLRADDEVKIVRLVQAHGSEWVLSKANDILSEHKNDGRKSGVAYIAHFLNAAAYGPRITKLRHKPTPELETDGVNVSEAENAAAEQELKRLEKELK